MILEGERAKRFFKMQPIDVNYDRKYYQNTFISATRAMSDYLLKPRYGTKCLFGFLFVHDAVKFYLLISYEITKIGFPLSFVS